MAGKNIESVGCWRSRSFPPTARIHGEGWPEGADLQKLEKARPADYVGFLG